MRKGKLEKKVYESLKTKKSKYSKTCMIIAEKKE